MSQVISCPQCGQSTVFDPSNEHRPFCSERCRVMDLGAWAEEKYSIPSEEPANEVNQNQNSDDEFSSKAGISSPWLH